MTTSFRLRRSPRLPSLSRYRVEGEGDVFRKAIQDLGAVVKENVKGSFSRSAFPLAIECLQAMRKTALTYEEVETYNEWVSLDGRISMTDAE